MVADFCWPGHMYRHLDAPVSRWWAAQWLGTKLLQAAGLQGLDVLLQVFVRFNGRGVTGRYALIVGGILKP